MRAIIAVLLALGTAISARAAAIVLHATTVLRFTDLALGTSRGIYDTSVADNELLTLLCGAPEAPVAMVASCQVGGRVACESFSSMMAFTTVSHVAGDVRLTVEVAGVAIGDGGIVTDQQVECSLQKSTILDNAAWPKNTTVATAVARPWAVPMASVKATADFSMAGTVKAMVAPVAKYFKEHVVATADKLGPFEHETSIDVFSVDATGNACSPTSSLPYLVLDSVSSQEGPLSCQPIEGDDCLSARCVLPATTTRLSVTLRPSESNAFSHDPLFAEVLVVPSRTQ